MQHPNHPDDERLAALAGGDPEVTSDAALRAHVDSCDRCGPMVRELGSLHAALGELPDMIPSRPLQLLPPVAEPQTARGGWLRRLAAPAMAAGFVLVVVGAIGSSGFSLGMASSAGPSAEAPAAGAPGEAAGRGDAEASGSEILRPTEVDGAQSTTEPAYNGGTGEQPRSQSSSPPTGEEIGPPAPADDGSSGGLFSAADPRMPWLVVLGLGVGLILAGIYFRFAVQPRAG